MREHPPQAALLDLRHIHSGAQGTGCETTRPGWARAGVTPSLVEMKREGFENPKTKVQSVIQRVLIYLSICGAATFSERSPFGSPHGVASVVVGAVGAVQ